MRARGLGWVPVRTIYISRQRLDPGFNHPLDEQAHTPSLCNYFHLTCLPFHFNFFFVIYVWKQFCSFKTQTLVHLENSSFCPYVLAASLGFAERETPFGLVGLAHGQPLQRAPPPSFCFGRRSWRLLLIPGPPLVHVIDTHLDRLEQSTSNTSAYCTGEVRVRMASNQVASRPTLACMVFGMNLKKVPPRSRHSPAGPCLR